MSAIAYALISVFIVSLISLIGVFTLSLNKDFLRRSVSFLVSLAVGALFGNAIIHLVPETFESFESSSEAGFFIILGILIFFVLEKFFHWHHHHEPVGHTHSINPVGRIVLFADGVHNFLDGVIIGAAYLVSPEIGIATTIAVILHEIPQEIGDFGVLIFAGYTRTKALLVNFLSALVSFAGVFFAFFLGGVSNALIPALIAISAGSFIYIAGSDLVPELQKTSDLKKSLLQFTAIIIGISLVFMV